MINAWKKFWPASEEFWEDEQVQVLERSQMFQISNVIERVSGFEECDESDVHK